MKRLAPIILAAALLVSASACDSASDGGGDGGMGVSPLPTGNDRFIPANILPMDSVTTYGQDGKEYTFDLEETPERVVAISNRAIETMLALELENRIVAAAWLEGEVDSIYTDFAVGINMIPDGDVTRERIEALNPDIIIGTADAFGDSALGGVEYWHSKGVKTYLAYNSGCLPEMTLENEMQDLINLGAIFGRLDKAGKIRNDILKNIMKIGEYAETLASKPKLAVVSAENGFLADLTATTFAGDLLTQMGAEPVSIGSGGADALAAANPDFIIVTAAPGGDKDAAVAGIAGNPALADLDAVKQNRVFCVADDLLRYSGPGTSDLIIEIDEHIYPDRIP